MVQTEDFVCVLRHARFSPEVPIKPIPTMPTTVAIPVWFSPKTGSPATIKKAPIKHNEIPNTNGTYAHRIYGKEHEKATSWAGTRDSS